MLGRWQICEQLRSVAETLRGLAEALRRAAEAAVSPELRAAPRIAATMLRLSARQGDN